MAAGCEEAHPCGESEGHYRYRPAKAQGAQQAKARVRLPVAMADPVPTSHGKHKTHRPDLTVEDVKFAQLLFASRSQPGARASVTKCYLDAGFPPHATDAATQQAAYRRVKNRQFRQFYRVLQDSAAASAQVTPNIVTQALARIALFDIRQVFDAQGCTRLPHEFSDAVAAGIASVETEELYEWQMVADPDTGAPASRRVLVGYARKVKRVPPTEALKILAQILRMTGQDADAAKGTVEKNSTVLEVELGPDVVAPPLESGG